MLSVDKRIDLMVGLGDYISSDNEEWIEVKHRAVSANSWFTAGNVDLAVNNIATNFLKANRLRQWVSQYPSQHAAPKLVGIVMAGNIPLVGFHDLLCGIISGHNLLIKLSTKDNILITHLLHKLSEQAPEIKEQVKIADTLKGCDAYIATGSNNTARYFEQYFGKYPNIIRKNRTSVAILDGSETPEELSLLADDIFSYFGLGCRNVTQVCLPHGYDLNILLEACKKYEDLIIHHKYKHNYDYYLAIYLLNKVPYITNNSLLMVENALPFSAVSVLHYRYYDDKQSLEKELSESDDIQCIVGKGHTAFGAAQSPQLNDYADGIDTMKFLCGL
ncbi:MAG: acyl-CoA reductase [Bacteroidetes bacterium]|nr:acyl-CoA reductase [Bacteroidota bacterium]